MVDAITEDLEYYNPDTQSRTQHQVISSPCVSTTSTSTTASSTTAIITDIDSNNNMKHVRAVLLQDTHTEYINNHQLQLLRIQYSDLLTTHTETKMIVGTLLGDLVEIEKAYALEVRSSRQKDGERGMSIIPDYKRVNQVADDVGKDAVVAAALKRAQDILIFGQGVRIKLDL